ncbi:MAG: nicotinate-nucleotide adenylyltransferase [Synechococcaceae cyanobacterium]|jgi:nicotinate-nucleotide adenylyltransferase|nr:nicotinate-nucleotide adenylyltransferase [Synechococcaceae cyanobacterium]
MSTPAAAPTIALFGTSADPPTQGHRALLEGLLAQFPRVATWASDNPLKQHGAPLAARTALLQALVAAIGDPRLQVVPELSSPWTMETLARARARWPTATPVFVVGGDLLPQIPRWRQAERWLPGCRLAVVPRRGWPLQAADLRELERRGAQLQVLPLEIPASASSALRHGLAAGQGAAEVPEELWPVLLQHNLYGLSAP